MVPYTYGATPIAARREQTVSLSRSDTSFVSILQPMYTSRDKSHRTNGMASPSGIRELQNEVRPTMRYVSL